MSAISFLGAAGVVTSLAHAQVRFADYEKQAPIYQACSQLAQSAAQEFATQENRQKMKCLDSDRVSNVSYERLLRDFSEDCTKAVVVKLGPQYDQYGDHDIHFSRTELSEMFDRHYRPVYDRYCSTWGVGQSTTTAPGQVE